MKTVEETEREERKVQALESIAKSLDELYDIMNDPNGVFVQAGITGNITVEQG